MSDNFVNGRSSIPFGGLKKSGLFIENWKKYQIQLTVCHSSLQLPLDSNIVMFYSSPEFHCPHVQLHSQLLIEFRNECSKTSILL